MPRMLVALLGVLLSATFSVAEWDDVGRHASCSYCGMDRAQFSKSRMLLEYDDGSDVGVCSLHCASVDLANHIDKFPAAIRVGDYASGKLIDAEKAVWVLGGNKPGVMTARAKWAFEQRSDAEAFAAEHGGTLVGFEDAIKAAYEDLYHDTRMIRERRKARRLQVQHQQPAAHH